MTDTQRDFDSLLLGVSGPPAAKFKNPGDFVEGTLTGKDTQHKSKFNPADPSDKSELLYFKSGDPILELVLTLQTDQIDPADENDKGLRRVYVPFQMQQELQKAVAAAGIKRSLPLGTHIKITHTHTVPSAGGGSPRKEYKVAVTPVADKLAVKTETPKTQTLSPELLELMRANGMKIPE